MFMKASIPEGTRIMRDFTIPLNELWEVMSVLERRLQIDFMIWQSIPYSWSMNWSMAVGIGLRPIGQTRGLVLETRIE